ncbi:MAG: damage-control phosphatase ARMT1 family protein [Pseudonocardiaceae bacterium]
MPAILSNVPRSFAWHVFNERHPKLVDQIHQAHPYPPEQHRALDTLLEETLTGRISPLAPTAHDHAAWNMWGERYVGERWVDAPFLWAESYFYRRLLDAVGFFHPGPWFWIDPFEFMKTAELHDPTLADELATLDELHRLPARELSQALMLASLWGNRADLGFRIGMAAAGSEPAQSADLVADDSATVWAALHTGAPQKICLVADNAGRELLADLILIDHLIQTGRAAQVVIHLKPQPYYVSDAGTADLVACLRRLAAATGSPADVARRLQQNLGEGRVSVYTHWFYCAPLPLHHMPPDLAHQFDSTLTILKGDLNYRRLVGDCHWPPTTPFAQAADYFPGPVVALRTLKSDVVVGLDPDTVSTLDASEQSWRTNGTHALIQARI